MDPPVHRAHGQGKWPHVRLHAAVRGRLVTGCSAKVDGLVVGAALVPAVEPGVVCSVRSMGLLLQGLCTRQGGAETAREPLGYVACVPGVLLCRGGRRVHPVVAEPARCARGGERAAQLAGFHLVGCHLCCCEVLAASHLYPRWVAAKLASSPVCGFMVGTLSHVVSVDSNFSGL